jgi:hypothetical protein
MEGPMSPEARPRHLGIELPDVMTPAGSYVPARVSGELIAEVVRSDP